MSRLATILYVLGVLAIGGAALSAGGRLLESRVAFCSSCHEMKFFGEKYVTSGASKHHPNCIVCHSGPGVLGAVSAQMTGLDELRVHFFGHPNPSRVFRPGVVPNENCIKCHVNGYNREAHEAVPLMGRSCAECHNHFRDQDFGGVVPLPASLPNLGPIRKRTVP
jgi:cytochrome c nitrite reductase small subunit